MCGIGGIFKYDLITNKRDKEEVYKILGKLLIGMQERGERATGISVINTFDNSARVYKMPIKASKFIRKERFRKELMKHKYNLVLLHTRAPTVGDPKYSYNNHPIVDDENNNIMVHNGGISNYEELRKKYPIKGIADVDSEVILAMYNYKKQNLKKALIELRGGIALALYDDKKLYLYANGNPINITYFKQKELWVFSSLEEYIKDAVSTKNKDYKIFEFDERIDGYDKYSNYEFRDEDLLEVDFSEQKKKVLLDLEPDVESLGRYGKGNGNGGNLYDHDNGFVSRSESGALSRLFDSGRQTNMQCDTCKKCIYKACPDRDTRNAERCRDIAKLSDVNGCNGKYIKLKNKGWKRITIFREDMIKELFPDGATNEEIELQR